MRAPRVAKRRVVSDSATSEPLTWYPRLSNTSAMPLMPMPPMPTKWMRRLVSNSTWPSLLHAVAGVKLTAGLWTADLDPWTIIDMHPPSPFVQFAVNTPDTHARRWRLRPDDREPSPREPCLQAAGGWS